MQTREGKGWNTILRLYAPLQPWFDNMKSVTVSRWRGCRRAREEYRMSSFKLGVPSAKD